MDVLSSSSNSSSAPALEVSLAELVDRMHANFVALPEELCVASRPSSPSSEARTAAWKSRISHALEVARGDTTHPKWGHVSGVTQLVCTSRRYAGVAPGVRMGDGRKTRVGEGFEWTLPATEKEWSRFEKKWEEAVNGQEKPKSHHVAKATRTSKYWPQPVDEQPEASSSRPAPLPTKADVIREKVERWQAEVAMEPAEDKPASQRTAEYSLSPKADKGKAKTKEAAASGEKGQTSLGFRVVKRSSVTSAKGDRPVIPRLKPSPPARPPTPPSQDHAPDPPAAASEPPDPGAGEPLPEHHRSQELPQIAEVSELSFLPPSFPSQLQTSTPPLNGRRQKPAPIAPCSPPPSSPHSPISSKSFDPSRPQRRDPPPASSSAPAASPERRPPKRARTPNSSTDDSMRVSQLSPPHKAPPPKKARTEPFSEQEPTSSGPQPVPPSTPPPTTSPPNVPVTPVSQHKGLGNAKGLPVPTTPDPHPLPTLTELLASSRRSKPRPRPPSRKHTPHGKSSAAAQAVHEREQLEAETELPAMAEDDREPSPAKTYFSSPASGSSDSASVIHRSPVSPLFTQNPGAFVPAFVSSQRPSANDDDPFVGGRSQSQSQGQGLMRGSSGVFGMGYNSQFDVEGQVDRVSELLERDVDYNGWLRDLEDDEEMPQAQSQGTVGVGY
ncbi:hypothetical protein OH77DRAFT_1511837 [Trametes cingulata]|nr:hypothetical protein OH77DRAFT_1511837 [Trametes cingulata]